MQARVWATTTVSIAASAAGFASGVLVTGSNAIGTKEAEVRYSDHLMYMSRRCGLLRWFHHRETVT
jgi:hypothetical protein